MRVALIFGITFGPLAVMALNIERDLKAVGPRSPKIPGSIRGKSRQPNNPLRARVDGSGTGEFSAGTEVSAWFQSVRATLISSTNYNFHFSSNIDVR